VRSISWGATRKGARNGEKSPATGAGAWKAAAELATDGPFVRGFEIYESLAPEALQEELPATTTLARKTADVKRAVRFLLQDARGNGCWDDSNYNFGGEDSLPNVYMAGTALAALALREWGDPAEVKTAVERAEKYMRDENSHPGSDSDEIVWAARVPAAVTSRK